MKASEIKERDEAIALFMGMECPPNGFRKDRHMLNRAARKLCKWGYTLEQLVVFSKTIKDKEYPEEPAEVWQIYFGNAGYGESKSYTKALWMAVSWSCDASMRHTKNLDIHEWTKLRKDWECQ